MAEALDEVVEDTVEREDTVEDQVVEVGIDEALDEVVEDTVEVHLLLEVDTLLVVLSEDTVEALVQVLRVHLLSEDTVEVHHEGVLVVEDTAEVHLLLEVDTLLAVLSEDTAEALVEDQEEVIRKMHPQDQVHEDIEIIVIEMVVHLQNNKKEANASFLLFSVFDIFPELMRKSFK